MRFFEMSKIIPLNGTQLNLNKSISELRKSKIISRRESKDIKKFKDEIAQDGLKNGTINVNIRRVKGLRKYLFNSPYLAIPKTKRLVSFRVESPDKKYALSSCVDIKSKKKGELKAALEGAYTGYKNICGKTFRKSFAKVSDKIIEEHNKKKSFLEELFKGMSNN